VEHESVHDESVGAETSGGVAKLIVDKVRSLIEHHEAREEHEDDHDDNLIEGLHEDGSPHFRLEERVSSR